MRPAGFVGYFLIESSAMGQQSPIQDRLAAGLLAAGPRAIALLVLYP
jgi:hypothetical protein